jgi:hypothetical protein
MSDETNSKLNTLTDEDVVAERGVGRRSMLGAIGATVLAAVATACGGDHARRGGGGGGSSGGSSDADSRDYAGQGRGNTSALTRNGPGLLVRTDPERNHAGSC